MAKELATVHIMVKGTVQGVGFRYYTRQLASSLGLNGFVKNLSSGEVEIEAEGEKQNLQELIRDLQTKEMAEYIYDLKLEWSAYQNKYQDFTIAF